MKNINVLIIKISAIGDVIMALPMIDAIHKKYSNAMITWMCGETVAPLLKTFGKVDEIIIVDEEKLLAGSLLEKLWALIKVWKNLFWRHFDLITIGHADPRYRLLRLTAIGKERRSFNRGHKRFWPVPGRHHTDEYIRLVTNRDSPEAIHERLPKLSIPLSADLKSELKSGDSLIVALSPGGAKNILRDDAVRRWPLEYYVALANKLIIKGIRVVITGAPSDEWIRKSFFHLDVINLVGKTSIIDLVALFGACDLIVTHDSSPIHLAGLAGKPIVALFGPTNPYEKVPRDNQSQILWGGEDLACRPCYDGKTYSICNNNICMQSIKVDAVYEAIVGMLGDLRRGTYCSF